MLRIPCQTIASCSNPRFQQWFRVPPEDLKSSLANFVSFAQSLKGDEKSEAQSFIDQFFRALGHKSAIEAGATFEFRVAKKPGSAQLELVVAGNGDPVSALRPRGGKKCADLLWPDRVLIEMKSRGENLEKHYDQTFDKKSKFLPAAIRESRIACSSLRLFPTTSSSKAVPANACAKRIIQSHSS